MNYLGIRLDTMQAGSEGNLTIEGVEMKCIDACQGRLSFIYIYQLAGNVPIIIRNNKFSNSKSAIQGALKVGKTHYITNNVFESGPGTTGQCYETIDNQGMANIFIENNVFLLNRRCNQWLTFEPRWNHIFNVYIQNNLIVSNNVQNQGLWRLIEFDRDIGYYSIHDVFIRNNVFDDNRTGYFIQTANTQLILKSGTLPGSTCDYGCEISNNYFNTDYLLLGKTWLVNTTNYNVAEDPIVVDFQRKGLGKSPRPFYLPSPRISGLYFSGTSPTTDFSGFSRKLDTDFSAGPFLQCLGRPANDLGYYIDDNICVDCEAGSWCDGTGNIFPCNESSVSSTGQVSCTVCSSGSYPNPSHTICVGCPSGSYCDGGQLFSCTANQYSLENSSSVSDCHCCAAGMRKNDLSNGCNDCLAETAAPYCSVICSNCSLGTYSNFSTTCLTCPSGSYCENGIAYSCGDSKFSVPGSMNVRNCTCCNEGEEPNSGKSGCESCVPGGISSYCSSNCSICQPGLYANISKCENCHSGSFCTGGKMSSCGPNEYSLPNSFNSTACSCCEGGKFRNLQKSGCDECLLGTISGYCSINCTICQDGTFAETSICSGCPSGSFCTGGIVIPCENSNEYSHPNSTNQTDCNCCDAGSKINLLKNGCDECESGTISTSCSSDCRVCNATSYANDDHSICLDCSAGYYCDGDGLRHQCGWGLFSSQPQSSCDECSFGFWPNENL